MNEKENMNIVCGPFDIRPGETHWDAYARIKAETFRRQAAEVVELIPRIYDADFPGVDIDAVHK